MRHKCLASFLVFALYFSISGFIMFAEIKHLTQAQTITTILSQADVYHKLPQYFEATLVRSRDEQSKRLTQELIQSLEPAMLQAEVEKNIGPFMDYLNSRGGLPNIFVDLAVFKKNLTQKQGFPPEALKEIPDSYSLSQIANPEQVFGRAKLAFKILNSGYWTLLVLSIVLLICLALLGLSYWPAIPRWVGLGLILPGATMLLLTLISLVLPQILMGQFGKGLDPEIVEMLNPVILAFNHASQKISLLYSGIIAGVGFVLILLSYIIPHPPAPKPSAQTPVPQTKTN